jgi:class 3 adenylate cyclase/tetratricopeptide (TPR) repeat protein
MTPNELTKVVEELEALVKTGNDYAQAETQARLLLAEADIENEPELHCKVLLALSTSLWRRGFAQEALLFAEQGLSLAQDNHFKTDEARALNTIGIVYEKFSDYPKALEYYGKALAIFEELGNKEGIAINLGNCGNVYKDISDYAKAVEYYNKALAVYEELGSKEGIARNLSNCGLVYQNLSDYPKALEYFGKSLALAEELGNKNGIAINLGNCGLVYQNLSDYSKALEYFGKALAVYEELGNKEGIARNLGNCGNVYVNLSDYSKALEYNGKALALYEELGSKEGIARNLGNCGNVYVNLSDYSKALEYNGKALALNEELGSKSGIATNLGNYGIVYGKEGFEGHDTAKAEEYLLKSLAMFEEIGARKQLYELHQELAELYEKTDRKSEAFDHFKKYHELEKEVQSEEAKKQADRLDYERKTAEHEKQLAIERAEAATVKRILHNTLPPIIADRLINNETFIADSYPSVSVLFMDLVNFTRIAAIIPPRHLIYLLNTIFSNADAVMEKHGLEKIKTIGDAYMAVAGAPVHQEDHAQRAALAALDVMEAMNNLSVSIPAELGDTAWIQQVDEIQVRIGLHCGEAIGGVIGDKKFTFDLWGDAVNTASRMESHGEAGRIHVSEEFAKNLTLRQAQYTAQTNLTQTLSKGEGLPFSFPLGEVSVERSRNGDGVLLPRGEIEIKGKGRMKTYFLEKET